MTTATNARSIAAPSDLGTPIRVRIGLHTGSVVREGSDFFGREVNYAARVASAALGGEVLVSEAVRERCAAAPGPSPPPGRSS